MVHAVQNVCFLLLLLSVCLCSYKNQYLSTSPMYLSVRERRRKRSFLTHSMSSLRSYSTLSFRWISAANSKTNWNKRIPKIGPSINIKHLPKQPSMLSNNVRYSTLTRNREFSMLLSSFNSFSFALDRWNTRHTSIICTLGSFRSMSVQPSIVTALHF